MSKFFKLTEKTLDTILSSRMSENELKIWLYLSVNNPFQNQYHAMPEILEIMEKCHCSKATAYRAIAKLQELKLMDFQIQKMDYRILNCDKQDDDFLTHETTFSPMRMDSHPCENFLTHETGFSPMRMDSHRCENRGPKSLPQGSFGNLKINQDLSRSNKIYQDHAIDDEIFLKENVNTSETKFGQKENKSNFIEKEEFNENLPAAKHNPPQADDIYSDPNFLAYCKKQLPQAKNILKYIQSTDKSSGKAIAEKMWREYQGEEKGDVLERYWANGIIPFEQMDWEKDFPDYKPWLNRVQGIHREDTFIEDSSLGYHRNLRICFVRWYQWKCRNDRPTEKENSPINQEALAIIKAFAQKFSNPVV